MVISVQEGTKSLEASVTLQRALFSEFSFDGDAVSFGLNLQSLMDCLSIVEVSSLPHVRLFLSHDPAEQQFELHLTEHDAVTECKLRTLEAEEAGLGLLGSAGEQETCVEAIVSSRFLHDALTEANDVVGANVIEMRLAEAAPQFSLVVAGVAGSCHIECELPNDAFVSFSVKRPIYACYKHALTKHAARALPFSRQTLLRMTFDGVLFLQHMLADELERKVFVHVMLIPDEAEPVEDEGRDSGGSDFRGP